MPLNRSSPRSWSRLPLLLLALLLSVSATAVGPFRYAEDQSPAIVNPLFTTTMAEARIGELMFESLYTDDKDLRTVPQLAASAEISADHTSMLVELRDDVRWHDGKPLVADDVVFTIKAMADKGTLSTEAGRVAWIKDAVAESEHQVRLTFNRPEASPEEKLYFKILPRHAFGALPIKRTDAFRTKPIGTGLFRLVRYNEDSSVSLARFDSHRQPARINEVVLREVSDKNYQAKLLLYESLEALVRVLPRDLAVLQGNRKVALYPYQTNSWWYVGYNLARAPFDDLRVRQALAAMVDPAALLAPVGTGDVVTGPFVRSSPYYNHTVPQPRVDLTRAAGLLTEAGWIKDAGRWTKDGKPLKLRLTAHKSLETAQEVVINLQSQLQSAGVAIEVEFLDDAAWKSQVWRDRNFDMILSQWSFDRNEDVREQFYSTGSRNFSGYKSAEVDALLDRSRTTMDPQDKKAALRELHARVAADAPMIFLWTLDSYSAMNARIRGVVVHPFYFFTWVRDWSTP